MTKRIAPQPPSSDLERFIWQLFIDLHRSQPNHEIFGEPAKDVVRLPLHSSRSGGQSWRKWCKQIAAWVSREMKSNFEITGCWMSRYGQVKIHASNRRIYVARLLAFLNDPTPLHWEYASRDAIRGTVIPFSQPCNNAAVKTEDGKVSFCINGVHHGKFTLTMSKRPFAGIDPIALRPPSSDLERILLQLFIDLHTSQPNHEIFGEPAKDVVRLPLYSSWPRGQSWATCCKQIAACVSKEMKSSFALTGCWMSRQKEILIRATSNRRRVVYQRVRIVRLLAFLADPTPRHWSYLTENGVRAIDTPFSHICGRGRKRQDGQVAYCVNGLHHGRFATVVENNSHNLCCHGARPLCPGHGQPPVTCIFTHPDGSLKPCLNLEDRVPKCSCARPCF